jgi:hypothetical protein
MQHLTQPAGPRHSKPLALTLIARLMFGVGCTSSTERIPPGEVAARGLRKQTGKNTYASG